ncbi:hypothetical protein A9Q81_24790 [Gammaproteobacteria bacterium 42_54_T18]|nr:hypothetical protein A9Q81_24790 [Gammaproteobacteria bacterium 42_54_T18]
MLSPISRNQQNKASMVYLIIILAMAMVVGPILWVRPSPKERRIAQFRSLAMEAGIKVEPISLISNEYYQRVSERNLHVADYQWVRYRRISKEGEAGSAIRGQWTQRKDRQGQLLWEPDPVTLKEPESIKAYIDQWRKDQDVRFLALEFGPRTVSVVWSEKGSVEDVKKLISMLKGLGES